MLKKIFKLGGIIVAALIGLVIVAVIVLKLISDNQYKDWITSAVKSATGRDFSIATLELEFNSSLRIKAGGVRLANAEWSNTADMVLVDHLEAEINLISLLNGVAEVRGVIEKANIIAETSADGQSNFAIGSGEAREQSSAAEAGKDLAADVESGGLPIRPLIREFRIVDSTFTVVRSADNFHKNIQITNLLVETPTEETTLSLVVDVDDIPIKLSGNLGNLDKVLDQSSSPVNLDGSIENNTIKIAGDWGPLLPDLNMALALELEIPSTSKLASLAQLDLAEVGVLKLTAAIKATDGLLSVGEIKTNLDGDLVVASIEGSVADLVNVDDINLTVTGNTRVLNKLLKHLNVTMPVILPPNVNMTAQIHGNLKSLGIKNFNTEIVDEGVKISVSAVVGNLFTSEGGHALFKATIDSTSNLSKYANLDLPDFGMLELSGEILSADKTINLENLDARLISDNINIQIAGSVNDLVRSKVIHTSLNADIGPLTEQNISELTALLQHFNIELPTPLLPKGAHISAKIRGNIDALAVKDINIEIRDDGLIVALVGQVDNALPPSGVDATVTVASDSLSVFSKYAGISIPALGALNVSTHIVSSDSGYRLQNLDARLGADEYDLTLSASIRDLLTLKGINAELSSTINSLAALSTIARKELPQTEPITLNATVSEGDETGDKGAMVTIEAASAGATVVLNGLLSDLTSAEDLTISIAVDAPSLSDFNQFLPNELPEKGPFSLTGNVEIKPGEFELNDFEVNLEDQSMNGNIGIKLAQDDSAHSTLKGELNIPYFDLSPYVIPDPDQVPDSTQPETVEATKPVSNQAGRKTDLAAEASEAVVPEPADRLFSSDPIPLDQLRKFDADFTVTADKLKIGKTDATDLKVTLSLVDGLLRVDPIKGLAGPGRLDGNVTIDGRSDAVVLAVDLLVDDMPMPNLGGGLDVKIKLDGEGQSVAEIMGGLDGRVLVVMRDGIIESSFVTNYGSGLFSFSGSKDTTELECGILRVDIEDGIADFDKKLAAQMTDVTWKGGGDINLKTESLDAGIVPKPRKGLGIGGGALAGLVHIGGTLKHPKIQLDPKDVAVKYGKYMAYVSTGGLSLLAEALYNKSQSDVDVCAKILDGTVFDEDETPESE